MIKKIRRPMERMLSGIMNLISRKRWYDVRAQNAVRRYCHLRNPSDIIDTILSIKMDIPCSGILKGKYLEGVIRLVYIEKLDESQFETINDILSIIKDSFVLQKRYDGDFNGLYYEDLCLGLMMASNVYWPKSVGFLQFRFISQIKNTLSIGSTPLRMPWNTQGWQVGAYRSHVVILRTTHNMVKHSMYA